jgi:purine-binding chemotaxis protein CheW
MTDSIVLSKKAPRFITLKSKVPSSETGDPIGFLCFILDGEEYGVDLQLVSQVVKPPPVTWVPRVPEQFLGVVSIRGEVVTLLDLRRLMGLEGTAWPRSARVLIVDIEGEQTGLLVDGVTQVRRVAVEQLERTPNLTHGIDADHVLCIARSETNQPIAVLNLDGILREKLR